MTPKEIADSRLARGEITLEEHRKILEQLSPDSTVNRKFASPAASAPPPPHQPPASSTYLPPQPPVPPPAAPAPAPSTFEIIKGLAGIALFVGVFVIYPFIARSNDIASARAECDQQARRIGVNCECFESRIRNETSVLWYVPLLRIFVRPSEAMSQSWLMQVTTQCQRR